MVCQRTRTLPPVRVRGAISQHIITTVLKIGVENWDSRLRTRYGKDAVES